MTNSRRALVGGVFAVLAYVGGAALSSHLSLTARAPLLDGFFVPPPYRWVSPPPALAAGNKRPASLHASIDLNPQTGSEANVWTTSDAQASLGLDAGAIPPAKGQTSVKLMITPRAPGRALSLPSGMTLVGDVYLINLTYQPSGKEIRKFAKPGVLVLAYPAPPNAAGYRHAMMRSEDGTTWTSLGGADSTGQLVVQEAVDSPGFYAVGQSRRGGGPPPKKSPWRGILDIALIAAAGGVVLFTVVIEVRHRRSRNRKAQARRP